MNEIEIKLQLSNKEKLLEKLRKRNCRFSHVQEQNDVIFIIDLYDTSNEEGKIFLRIRKENQKIILTLKKQGSILMESKEIEFAVEDFDKCYDFLKTLGYHEWVRVNKKRITTTLDGFHICIDEVERLGDFVEIEIMTEEEGRAEYYEKEMLALCKELELDSSYRIFEHYDTMISKLSI